MSHELSALPFSGLGLRALAEQFGRDVDTIARGLVLRVGGRCYLDEATGERPDAGDLVMTGLLELMHLERVRASTVAGLFGHERLEIIRQLVRVRTGAEPCVDHDAERVLTVLRKALRLVSDSEAPRRYRTAPTRPCSTQPLLPSDDDLGEDSLDLGWTA